MPRPKRTPKRTPEDDLVPLYQTIELLGGKPKLELMFGIQHIGILLDQDKTGDLDKDRYGLCFHFPPRWSCKGLDWDHYNVQPGCFVVLFLEPGGTYLMCFYTSDPKGLHHEVPGVPADKLISTFEKHTGHPLSEHTALCCRMTSTLARIKTRQERREAEEAAEADKLD